VEFEELVRIKLGSLKNFDLADKDILKGINALTFLLNLLANHFRNELVDQILQFAGSSFLSHNVHHLLADLADLR